jgi:Secretion system C-terminal sorting domain
VKSNKIGLILALTVISAFIVQSQSVDQNWISSLKFEFKTLKDSTLTERTYHLFDANGNISGAVTFAWNKRKQLWQGVQKNEAAWNNFGKRTIYSEYIWDTVSSGWRGRRKHKWTYDINGNQTVYEYSLWDQANNDWAFSSKNEYSYNSNGKKTGETYYTWNTNPGIWIAYLKDEWYFDVSGNQTLHMKLWMDALLQNWKCSEKLESEWDTAGNKISEAHYYAQWDNDSFYGDYKWEYFYDENNRQVLRYYYGWDNSTKYWVIHQKTENSYDGNGNLTLITYSDWNSATMTWFDDHKYIYTYDSMGNKTLEIGSVRLSDSTDWKYLDKREFEYDSHGRLTSYRWLEWWDGFDGWWGYSRTDYSYDDMGNLTMDTWYDWDFIYNSDPSGYNWYYGGKTEYFYDKDLNRILTIYNVWYPNGDIWGMQYKIYMTYKEPVIKKGTDVTIYPNPCKDIIFIALQNESGFDSFELFDFNGRKLLTSQEYTSDLSFLTRGVYYVKVKTRDGRLLSTVKLIKD